MAWIAPVIHASADDVLKITYVNDLPATSSGTCAVNPCMNMTNLRFHGLTFSPNCPQDDVTGMMAMPGQALRYSVEIPRDHPPGLFTGAIVIEGMQRYVPEVRTTPVDAGPDGDPNPEMVLADLVQPNSDQPGSDRLSANPLPEQFHAIDPRPPRYKEIDVEALKKAEPKFTVTLADDNEIRCAGE